MAGKRNIILVLALVLSIASYARAQNVPKYYQKVEQIRQKIKFARDLQLTAQNIEAARLIRISDVSLKRSLEAARARRRIIAGRQLRRSEDAINSALKILFENHIENRRRKLENLLGRAKKFIQNADNPDAERLYQQALKNRDLAIKAFKRSDFKQALINYNKAVFLLKKLLASEPSIAKSNDQIAEDEAYRFQQFYQKNKEVFENSQDGDVQKNVTTALDLAEKAKAARRSGNYEKSIENYRQATRLLSRALNIATGKKGDAEFQAEEEIALLDKLVDNLDAQLPQQMAQTDELLLSQIHLLQENAHTFLESQNFNEAIKNANMARNLAERLLKKIKTPKAEGPLSIENRLNKLSDKIEKLEKEVTQSTDIEVKTLVNYAKEGNKKAENALFNKKPYIASEVISMSENLLDFTQGIIDGRAPQLKPEDLKREIENLYKIIEKNQNKIKRSQNGHAEFHYSQAKNMLDLAQENYDKGFLHVSNAFLQLSKNHLKKIGLIP